MVRGNFIGAAIVAIIYTVYILINPLPTKWQMVLALVVLNALTIVLVCFCIQIKKSWIYIYIIFGIF